MRPLKSLSFRVTCWLAWSSSAGALFLGIRDDDNGEAGGPLGPFSSHGPPGLSGPPGHPSSPGDGNQPTYLPFWPPPSTSPLTSAPSAPSSPPTSQAPRSTPDHSTAVPVTGSPSSSTASSSRSTRLGYSASSKTSLGDLPSSSSASTGTATAMPSSVLSSSVASASHTATSDVGSGMASNRTLTITLSSVLSVVGALLLVGALILCLRYRKRRIPFLRGITPIDDDEIATWKTSREEKAALATSGAAAGTRAQGESLYTSRPSHGKHTSTSTVKKPPSVIVYQGRHSQQLPRPSGEGSPRSVNYSYTSPDFNGRTSFDKETMPIPQTPIQAVAPNARAGLTDEAVPGDDPFLPSPKRQTSRLSKVHPNITSPRGGGSHMHTRTRSSRSSMRSFGGGEGGYYTGSDMELSPRTSSDYYSNMHSHGQGHSRVYSTSFVPPRVSLSEDSVVAGGLSPRPLFRGDNDMIGRAIG